MVICLINAMTYERDSQFNYGYKLRIICISILLVGTNYFGKSWNSAQDNIF